MGDKGKRDKGKREEPKKRQANTKREAEAKKRQNEINDQSGYSLSNCSDIEK